MEGTGTTRKNLKVSGATRANIRDAKTHSKRLKGVSERVKKMGLKNGGMKSEERPAVMKEEGKKGTVGYSAI